MIKCADNFSNFIICLYEVTGDWRKLHDEEHHLPYSSPKYYLGDQIKEGELGGAWHIGERRELHTQY